MRDIGIDISAQRSKPVSDFEGQQFERWVGSGLLVTERQFRRVIGYRQIPLLLSTMANAVSKKPIAKQVAVA
jgi:hypothetical protein